MSSRQEKEEARGGRGRLEGQISGQPVHVNHVGLTHKKDLRSRTALQALWKSQLRGKGNRNGSCNEKGDSTSEFGPFRLTTTPGSIDLAPGFHHDDRSRVKIWLLLSRSEGRRGWRLADHRSLPLVARSIWRTKEGPFPVMDYQVGWAFRTSLLTTMGSGDCPRARPLVHTLARPASTPGTSNWNRIKSMQGYSDSSDCWERRGERKASIEVWGGEGYTTVMADSEANIFRFSDGYFKRRRSPLRLGVWGGGVIGGWVEIVGVFVGDLLAFVSPCLIPATRVWQEM